MYVSKNTSPKIDQFHHLDSNKVHSLYNEPRIIYYVLYSNLDNDEIGLFLDSYL